MRKIVILGLILWLAASLPSPAATILVPSEYPTIQEAINAAQNGDTVIISPARYMGPGNREISVMNKAITVQSADPNDTNVVASTIIDCAPTNASDRGGRWGFRFTQVNTSSVLDGVTIINVKSGNIGGGIICERSATTIRNCVIRNCVAPNSSGIYFYDGYDYEEPGYPYPLYFYPKIINCTIRDNVAYESGGGIYCARSSPTIISCIISNNIAYRANNKTYGKGGGIYCSQGSRPVIMNCVIGGNRAGLGGGICTEYGVTSLDNSIIIGNTASLNGGGIYAGNPIFNTSFPLNVTNCAVAANIAGQRGGGIYDASTTALPSIINNIAWGNSDVAGAGQFAQIDLSNYYPLRPADIAFNCIQDDNPNDANIPFDEWGNQNIDDDPKFVRNPNDGGDGWGDDPQTPNVNEGANDDFGDLHLQKVSPCINAGMPNYFAGDKVDMDGQPRVVGTRIDIGIDEYTPMIVVTEPKGGEAWAGGSKHEIKWESFGVDGTVDILYSANGGTGWQQIGSSDVSAGNYLWQLPNEIDSNRCLISVAPSTPAADVLSINSNIFSVNSFSPWPGKQPNGKAGLKMGPKQACVKWQFATGGPVTAAATVGHDNKVYVACEDGKLYALDANDGTLKWSYDAKSPLIASVGVSHHGIVYVGDSDGRLHALNRQGQLQWTHNTYGPIHSTPVITRDNNIYLCSQDGTLYALAQNGSELWCFDTAGFGQLGGSIFATPQIADDGTVYLAGLYDPNLYAINPADGSIKWIRNLGRNNGWPFAPPAIAEDGVLYQTLLYDGNLYAIEPEKGEIIWSVNLADPCSINSAGWSQPVIGPDGTIYVCAAGAYIEAVNPDGTIKWATKPGDVGGLTLTVDKEGLLYAASDDKHLYIINPNGQVISEFTGSGWLSWPVIAKERMLIVSDVNNLVWALSDDACSSRSTTDGKQKGKK